MGESRVGQAASLASYSSRRAFVRCRPNQDSRDGKLGHRCDRFRFSLVLPEKPAKTSTGASANDAAGKDGGNCGEQAGAHRLDFAQAVENQETKARDDGEPVCWAKYPPHKAPAMLVGTYPYGIVQIVDKPLWPNRITLLLIQPALSLRGSAFLARDKSLSSRRLTL